MAFEGGLNMKYFRIITPLIILGCLPLNSAQAQSNMESYFVGGTFFYDVAMISDDIIPPFDPDFYLMGFWSKGIELGKRNERKAYSLYFRFGENVNEPDLTVGNGFDDEFEFEKYVQISGVYPWKFNKYRSTDSDLLFNIRIRNFISLSRFTGVQIVDDF